MTKSSMTTKPLKHEYVKGDLFINKYKDMIYMIISTCTNDGAIIDKRNMQAVCVWSDDELNKHRRDACEHVARIGEYRTGIDLIYWDRFVGVIHLTQEK